MHVLWLGDFKMVIWLFVESTRTDLLNNLNSIICQGIYYICYLLFPSSYGLTDLYSLFLAETLKYQYLLFDDKELDEWVFINNAEVHSLFSTWRWTWILIGREINSIACSSSFEWQLEPWLTNHPTAGPRIWMLLPDPCWWYQIQGLGVLS